MNAAMFRRLRTALSDSDEELAADLGVTPAMLQDWASGVRRIPRAHAKHLSWRAAVAQREIALAASELPECSWMQRWQNAPIGSHPDDLPAELHTEEAHFQSCTRCQAREQFVLDRFGPMPQYPRELWMRALEVPLALPTWLQPAAFGALILLGIVGVRVLIAATTARNFALRDALFALGAAAGAGALAGFTYSLTRPTLRKLGTLGAYLTGIVCIVSYMGSVALVAPIAFGETLIDDRADLIAFLVLATLFGLVFGHSAFRDAGS